jgi:hypothetical protein
MGAEPRAWNMAADAEINDDLQEEYYAALQRGECSVGSQARFVVEHNLRQIRSAQVNGQCPERGGHLSRSHSTDPSREVP